MPHSTHADLVELRDHINSILLPLQSCAELLQKCDEDATALAGIMLDSLCNEANTKLDRLTSGLENKFGTISVRETFTSEIVCSGLEQEELCCGKR